VETSLTCDPGGNRSEVPNAISAFLQSKQAIRLRFRGEHQEDRGAFKAFTQKHLWEGSKREKRSMTS
jgi:hypothetical protein